MTLKAVDPGVFPFYGKLELTPAGTLKDRLQSDTVVLSDDARARLKTDPESSQDRRPGFPRCRNRHSGARSYVRQLHCGPRVMLSRKRSIAQVFFVSGAALRFACS